MQLLFILIFVKICHNYQNTINWNSSMTVFVKIFIGQVMNLLGFKNFQSVVGKFSDFPKYLRKDLMIKDGAKEQSQANDNENDVVNR